MITRAVLWVSHPTLLLERLGGMSVLERQLFALRRAGLEQVLVSARKPASLPGLRWPDGLQVLWAAGDGAAPQLDPPYLGVSGDHLVRIETLRYLAEAPYRGPVAFQDAWGASVAQFIPFRLDRSFEFPKQPLPAGASLLLEAPVDSPPARRWLLACGVKSQDGFMARHFDRHLSLAFTRLLLDTPMTPNLMTAASASVGLAGAACFLSPSPARALAGAGLIWLHSVLDGCDGEIARIKFQESARGANLDFWADNVVHLALFACLGLGYQRVSGSALPLLLGVLAGGGVIASAAVVFARRSKAALGEAKDLGLQSWLGRLENFLAQRDFIYLLAVMAYFNATYYFLWAGALGAPLFLAALLSGPGSSPGRPAAAAGGGT